MPRPVDIAVIISQMMVDLALLIHEHEPYRRRNLGAALEEIFVSLLLNATAGEDRPLTATEIAEHLSVPRSNVLRHLKTLERAGRLRKIGTSYMTDLERLNAMTPSERYEQTRRIVVQAGYALAKLRGDDQD
jgi:DNA-binding transcriptional ArsR family regulator